VQPNSTKPKARIRIARSNHKAIEFKDEGDQGWAVSYADLLMVLLSFFIIFFSVDDSKKKSLIETLSLSMKSKSDGKASASGDNSQARTPQFIDTGVIDSMSKELNLKVSATSDQLIIEFPENLFDSGKTILNKSSEQMINDVLEKILPFSKKIGITIVGHTDSAPIVKSSNIWIQDNIDLSARRATSVYKILKSQGFDENRIDIKASGPHVRSTRSISILIQEKAEVL
jgi:flagellar motor protein MotB